MSSKLQTKFKLLIVLCSSSCLSSIRLRHAGYTLDVEEVDQLLDHIDTAHTGVVAKSQLAASQIDWQAMQQSNAERWLASAHKVFRHFDTDEDGIIASEQIVACLRSKLPPSEVQPILCSMHDSCLLPATLCMPHFACPAKKARMHAYAVVQEERLLAEETQWSC